MRAAYEGLGDLVTTFDPYSTGRVVVTLSDQISVNGERLYDHHVPAGTCNVGNVDCGLGN